jgi:hypothetical protein
MDHNRASYRQQCNRARTPIEDLVLTTARSSPTFVTACICLDMADGKRTLYWSRTCILFFVCAFIHVLHGRLYYVSILLLHRQSRHTIVTTDWPLGLVVPNPSGTTRGPHVDVNSCQRQHEPDLRHAVMCCAVLCYAMICLCCDVMCCAVLCCAVKM